MYTEIAEQSHLIRSQTKFRGMLIVGVNYSTLNKITLQDTLRSGAVSEGYISYGLHLTEVFRQHDFSFHFVDFFHVAKLDNGGEVYVTNITVV